MTNALITKIEELRQERKAVILAHHFQPPEVQQIADHVGDTLDLCRYASRASAGAALVCGVHSMAETAAILCPDKVILMPEIAAQCRMADMIDAEKLRHLKKQFPGARTVACVNSSAAVKAESDVCCTAANAVAIVNALPQGEIIFVPDRNLGNYVERMTGRQLICSEGYCPVHEKILGHDILRLKAEHPHAEVVAHPGCPEDVIAAADTVFSSGGMCRYARETGSAELIVATEAGVIARLQKEHPDKTFYPAYPSALCDDMKKITLEKILLSLEEMKYRVTVDESLRGAARKALDAMFACEEGSCR